MRFLIGHRLTKLIGLGVQTHRHCVPYNPVNDGQKVRKNLICLKSLQNLCLVFTIMMVHALTQNTMKQRASIIDTYIYIVSALHRMVRSPHTLQVSISTNIQNTSRTGHGHCL